MRELLAKPTTKDDRPVPTSYAGVKKRANVLVACLDCRKRKIRCDNRRPRCTSCATSNRECLFEAPDSVASQRDALATQMQAMSKRDSLLLGVFEALRTAEGEQLDEIIRRIRSTDSVDEFLEMVDDASLLLPPVFLGGPTKAAR